MTGVFCFLGGGKSTHTSGKKFVVIKIEKSEADFNGRYSGKDRVIGSAN